MLPSPSFGEIRKMQRALARDVAQRVAADVAVLGGVRHGADADAIEHDPDHAAEAASGIIPATRRTCFRLTVPIRSALRGFAR